MSEKQVDAALVQRVLRGDQEAFNVLVLKYQHKIMMVVKRTLDDPQLIRDITQETFLNAYRSLDTFQGKSAFYTWLYRIAVNTVRNHTRIKTHRPPDIDIDIIDAETLLQRPETQETTTPYSLIHRDELQQAVVCAVNELPDALRISIILREMGGLSYDEIATLMHCPVGTVRSRIFRARHIVDASIKPLLEG